MSSAVTLLLESSRRDFLAATANLTDEQAAAKPDPARWSVLEVVEHVTFVEHRFLGWLEAASYSATPRIDAQQEQTLSGKVRDRGVKVQAPEAVRPKGIYTSVAEALQNFNAARDRSIQLAQSKAADLYHLNATHPRFGDVNGVELFYIIAGHANRHAAQIRESRESPADPS